MLTASRLDLGIGAVNIFENFFCKNHTIINNQDSV